MEGFAAPDDFTEATPALEFLAQDDVLFFQLKLQPIGIGGHITTIPQFLQLRRCAIMQFPKSTRF
jgi:hypothetical protein